jgi:hypothetical protein
MTSQNPGISAAGRALGRTALNPASGPAAIGGMLQTGQPDDDLTDIDLADVRSRLAKAISDITKLANAMEALAVTVVPGTDDSDDTVDADRHERMPDIGGYLSERVGHQEAS